MAAVVECASMNDLDRVAIAVQNNRHKILEVLAKNSEKEKNNSTEHLSTLLKLKYKTVAFHLKALEDAGLVEGKFVLIENDAIKCYHVTNKGREIFSRLEGLK
jgi:DNA-binding transcriptional ArsR family regulator